MNERLRDPRFDTLEQHSLLDGLDHFTGIAAVLVTLMIGFDIYFWLGLGRPPKLTIVWGAAIAISMWKRTVSGPHDGRCPRRGTAQWLATAS